MEKLLTISDINQVWDNYNEAIKELENFEYKTGTTKKAIVQRMKNAVEILVDNEKIPIQRKNISSFVWGELKKRKITYDYSTFISLFDPDEKGNYSKSGDSPLHEHEFPESNPSECTCGALQYNGLIYELEKIEELVDRSSTTDKLDGDKEDPYSNPVTEYLQRQANNCHEVGSQLESLISKYYSSEDVAKQFEDVIKPNIKEEKELEAELIHLARQTDYRIRVTELAKIKAILMESCKHGIAEIAKYLVPPCVKCGHRGITPKHMSFNLLKKDREKILNQLTFFKCIEIKIGDKTVNIDFSDWFEQQCIRGKLNLPIENPILVSFVAI